MAKIVGILPVAIRFVALTDLSLLKLLISSASLCCLEYISRRAAKQTHVVRVRVPSHLASKGLAGIACQDRRLARWLAG